MKINFEKLNQVPYITHIYNHSRFGDWVEYYEKLWTSQSEKALDDAALIRAIECTNGCIQYAFRDKESHALSLEKTRCSMKLSMSIIKNKRVVLKSGEIIEFDDSIHHILDDIRDIYIEGFKMGNGDKLMEFYAQSFAVFCVLGRERLERQFEFIREEFGDVFDYFLDIGRDYVCAFLRASAEPVSKVA
jgi:hypothetical protein